ncbi:MAG: hypothetical protein ACI92C_002479, partial [Neolewinella sp.]
FRSKVHWPEPFLRHPIPLAYLESGVQIHPYFTVLVVKGRELNKTCFLIW